MLLLSNIGIVTIIITVLWLFLTVPWVGLQCVFVVFPDYTHLLLDSKIKGFPSTLKTGQVKLDYVNSLLLKVQF